LYKGFGEIWGWLLGLKALMGELAEDFAKTFFHFQG